MDTNYTTKSQEAISGAMQAAAAAGNPQNEHHRQGTQHTEQLKNRKQRQKN